MTSASRSDGGNRRNLAVYQTPAPPDGWEGDDLVRIVDPVGLAMAWLSTRQGGAVAALHLRDSVDAAWQPVLESGAARPAVRLEAGNAIGWTMIRRDPVSAAFSDSGNRFVHEIRCESGALTLRVPVSTAVRIHHPDDLEIATTRTGSAKEVILRRP